MATVTRYALGLLLAAHGWVHFVYVASSRGWFGPDAGWRWNGRSWLLSRTFGERVVLDAASPLFLLVAAGLVTGGVGYVLGRGPWRPVVAGSAVLSMGLYAALWDGEIGDLSEKGALGVAIDVAILVWVVVLA